MKTYHKLLFEKEVIPTALKVITFYICLNIIILCQQMANCKYILCGSLK